MNILLLEDEPELSLVAREQLEARGHVVYTALNIAESKQIIEDEQMQIDVLIADHQVPDGFGARFAIGTHAMPEDIKVIVVSGRLTIADVEDLEAHGIAYFNKPCNYADIVDQVTQVGN